MSDCARQSDSQRSLNAFGDQTEEEQFIIYQPRDTELSSHPTQPISTHVDFKDRRSQRKESFGFQPFEAENSHSTLGLLGPFEEEKEENVFVSQTERKRATLQLHAKNLLFEESEHKTNVFEYDPLSTTFQKRMENNKIEGFHPDMFPSYASITGKGARNKTISLAKYSNFSNINGQSEYWSKKGQSTHLKKESRRQKEAKQPPEYGMDRSHHLIRTILCKINNIKSVNAPVNEFQVLNQKFIALQDKYHGKKTSAAKKIATRVKTQGDQCWNNAKYISSLDIRKLISPVQEKIGFCKQGEYPYNLKTNEAGIKTRYEHFKHSNQQPKKSNMRNFSTEITNPIQSIEMQNPLQMNPKDGISNKQSARRHKSGADLAREKIGKIFRRLKELKSRETTKSNTRGSLHNIHSLGNRQQSAMKLQWSRQRSKLRNNMLKSQTEDMGKLSIVACEAYHRSAMNVLRFKGHEQKDKSCKVISPIFIVPQKG